MMMTRRQATVGLIATATVAAESREVVADDFKSIEFPPPRREGGLPLIAMLGATEGI